MTCTPTHPSYWDDEMAALALQLEEIEVQTLTDKGKYAANSPPDAQMAFFAFQQEMIEHLRFLNDVKLAHSVARAVDADWPLIDMITQGDHQVVEDRRVALDMSTIDDDLEDPPNCAPTIQAIDCRSEFTDLIERFLKEEDVDEDEEIVAGPSMSYADRQKVVLTKLPLSTYKCVVCMDQFRLHQITRLGCGDRYCHDCMKQLIMRAARDEIYYPARCCRQPISLGLIEGHLSEQEAKIYDAAVVEFSTENRTYCHVNSCGAFIPPSQIDGDRGVCEECSTSTCITCKSTAHIGHCPEDPDLEATLALVAAEGWQRCRRCGLLVDLLSGCFHMR
jgi:hypothetical protein